MVNIILKGFSTFMLGMALVPMVMSQPMKDNPEVNSMFALYLIAAILAWKE